MLDENESITELFGRISKYFSFFDYDLIRLLVRTLGSNSDKKKYNKYKKTFQGFSELRLCECPGDAFGDVEISEKVYALKIDNKSMDSFTLQELQMNNILGHRLLRILSVEDGCIKLTIRTFEDEEFNVSEKQLRELGELDVISISYGDKHLDIPKAISFENSDEKRSKCNVNL